MQNIETRYEENSGCRLQELRARARDLELKLDENSRRFIEDTNEWRRVCKDIARLEEQLRWKRFIRYCNTACWRYRVYDSIRPAR